MDDSFSPDEAVGHLTDVAALAFYQDHLHAHVVVKVDVQGGNDGLAHIVLDGIEFVGKFPHVVIVDEGYRTDGLFIGFPLGFDEEIPDEIPQGLGPVTVPLILDEPVETLKQTVRYGNTEPGSFF